MSRLRFDYDDELVNALRKVYGEDVGKFLSVLSLPPLRYYVRVNTLKTSVDDVIRRLRERGVEVYRDEHLEEAIYFPVKGPNNIPAVSRYVIADKRASESVILGADLYIPGVLGGDFKTGSEVNVITLYGDVIAYGIAMVDSNDIRRISSGVAVKVIKSIYEVVKVRELPEFHEGLIYPQSYPSMIVSRLLNPASGEVIVDTCAAPGGKTGHIVELSKGKALVYAFDHSKNKIVDMITELKRLGHLNLVNVIKSDSRYLHVDYPWLKADKVLIDPPCSSLGVIPKVGDFKRYSEVLMLSKYQFQFIRSAVNVLKSNGLLVYSTCTVTIEENEEIILRAVRELGLEVVMPIIRLGSSGIGTLFNDHLIRFHPHIHRQPGYFIAVLRKVNG